MSRKPSKREIAEQNEYLLERQREFRMAAESVADAFAKFREVEKIVPFGSVAGELKKEIPRFTAYRRAGIAVYHECKDVDLAVWIDDTSRLREMARASSRVLNELVESGQAHVAHHQVDIFLMEPGTDRYLGRLCQFNRCPRDKPECLVPGCGETLFLQQHEDFTLVPEALSPSRTVRLFERSNKGGSRANSGNDGGNEKTE